MLYLLAIICPPVAVLSCGKPLQFLLNLMLTLFFWIPGVVHAMLVVSSKLADSRTNRIVGAIRSAQPRGQYRYTPLVAQPAKLITYRIVGADRSTGADLELVVRATNDVDAESQASEAGVLVSSIRRV